MVYIVEAHRMERLTKDFAGERIFIPTNYGMWTRIFYVFPYLMARLTF